MKEKPGKGQKPEINQKAASKRAEGPMVSKEFQRILQCYDCIRAMLDDLNRDPLGEASDPELASILKGRSPEELDAEEKAAYLYALEERRNSVNTEAARRYVKLAEETAGEGAAPGPRRGRERPRIDDLTGAAMESQPLTGLLAERWYKFISGSPKGLAEGAPLWPGPLKGGDWRHLLFVHLELKRALSPVNPVAPGLLEEAVNRIGYDGAAAGGDLIRQAEALSEAVSAKRLLQAAKEFCRSAAGAQPLGGLPKPGPEGTPGGAPKAISEFCRDAAAVRKAWAACLLALEGLSRAVRELSSRGLGKIFRGLDEAAGLEPEELAEFCAANAAGWDAAADGFYRRAVAAFDPVLAARNALRSLQAALEAEEGRRRDALVLLDVSRALDSLPDGASDWEEKVPLAAVVMRLLKAPKPLTDDDYAPLENDFSYGFSKKFKLGGYDSTLSAPPSPPSPAPPAEAAPQVKAHGWQAAAGKAAARAQEEAEDAFAEDEDEEEEEGEEQAGELQADLPEPSADSVTGEAAGEDSVALAGSAAGLAGAPEAEEEDGAAGEAQAPDEVPAEAEAEAQAEDPFVEFRGMSSRGIAALILERFQEDLQDGDSGAGAGAPSGAAGPAGGDGSAGPGAPPDGAGEASGRPGPETVWFEDFRTLEGGDGLDLAEDPSAAPPASSFASESSLPASSGPMAAPSSGAGAEEAATFRSGAPYGRGGAQELAQAKGSLEAALEAQASLISLQEAARLREAEEARRRGFRLHLAALCRRLAGEGETRPLYWLSKASPAGVFPRQLARLLHLGLNFRPSPAQLRKECVEAAVALRPLWDPEAGERVSPEDPEPLLLFYAALLRPAVAAPGPDMSQFFAGLSVLLPARLRAGLPEALRDLCLRASPSLAARALQDLARGRDLDRSREALEETTRKFFEDMPKRSTSYVPANAIWKNLISPGGDLRDLVEKCRAGQGDLQALLEEAGALRDQARVREIVNRHDYRLKNKEEIHARAFSALVSHCALTAELALDWLDFHGASDRGAESAEWVGRLLENAFSEAGKALEILPEAPGGGGPGNGSGAAEAMADPGSDLSSRASDGARLLRAGLAAAEARSFPDDWGRERRTAWGAEGFHARDADCDLAAWLILCPGANSSSGNPAGPLHGVLKALATGPLDADGESEAFLSRLTEGEALIPSYYLEAVGGARERSLEGAEGQTLGAIFAESALGFFDAAEDRLAQTVRTVQDYAGGGALEPERARELARQAEEAAESVRAGADALDMQAVAAIIPEGGLLEDEARAALSERAARLRRKIEILRAAVPGVSAHVEDLVGRLVCDKSREADAASDLLGMETARLLLDVGQFPRLQDPAPEEGLAWAFMEMLPALKGAAAPFPAARELWAERQAKAAGAAESPKGSKAAAGRGSVKGAGKVSAKAPPAPPIVKIWDDLVRAGAPEAAEAEAAGAADRLVRWLGFEQVKAPVPGPRGGGAYPWRQFAARALSRPPFNAWSSSAPEQASLLLWWGGDSGPAHLIEALREWEPEAGSLPLAVSAGPLTAGARGALWGWARDEGRDLVVLDLNLAAFLAAVSPAARLERQERLFMAGAVYGSFRPFAGGRPRKSRDILAGIGRKPFSVKDWTGVARLSLVPGPHERWLLEEILRDPSVSNPAARRLACLVDAREAAPASGGGGELTAILSKAAKALGLPGPDSAGGGIAWVKRLTAQRGRKAAPAQVTVIADGADGLTERILQDEEELGLLLHIAGGQGELRLILAGGAIAGLLDTHPSSPLAALPPPRRLPEPGPFQLLADLVSHLELAGFRFSRPTLPYRILASAFWNWSGVAILADRVTEEALREAGPDAAPPFIVTPGAVARALADPGTEGKLRELALAPLSLDPRYRPIALGAAFMEHAGETAFPGAGLSDLGLLRNLKDFWPEAFRDIGRTELSGLCWELMRLGIFLPDLHGLKLRSEAHRRLLGDPDTVLDELSELKGLQAPQDSPLLSARRILPAAALREDGDVQGEAEGSPFPVPSPLTLLQEAALFWPGRPFCQAITGAPAGGLARASAALKSLCALQNSNGGGIRALCLRLSGPSAWPGDDSPLKERLEAEADALAPYTRLILFLDEIPRGPGGAQDPPPAGEAAGRRSEAVRAALGELPANKKALITPILLGSADDFPAIPFEDNDLMDMGFTRWTCGAVADWLSRCGLDPSEAEAILRRTSGWDSLVMAEAHRLGGHDFPSLLPEEYPNGAPAALRDCVQALQGQPPFTEDEARAMLFGPAGGDEARLKKIFSLLVCLSVIVPAGERGGRALWKTDSRFS
ncbi:MAG: hypothetical protein LBW85_12485 [Deltaproteobacteria bacterium]|jgi:hypothetical protein|nr:hypothetical protein [Deltaproteobacteria bacterium]